MNDAPTVFVVDPDAQIREAIANLAAAMSYQCEPYASGKDFLRERIRSRPGCAVLELTIPDINGLQLQEILASEEPRLPVIFLTDYGTISIAVRAVRAGAVDFLEKPLRESQLWDAILEAIQLDRERRGQWTRRQELEQCLSELTSREKRELRMIAEGKTKHIIAEEMGVCIRTAEIHRSQMMKKLGFEFSEQLVHFALCAYDGHSPVTPPQHAAQVNVPEALKK